ncbi:MAG: 2-amino-4-hydroxy-6-hydroxymethyldihydropteridine diphosphokinase [Planctomycetota bacterium]
MHTTALVALGSNVGDRLTHLRGAAAAIRALPRVRGFHASRLYETPALRLDGVGELGGVDAFLNAAVMFETDATPHALLANLLDIETRLGRLPRSQRETWGPRPIDLDLLMLGDTRVDDPTLTLPHPRIAERWFVLAPLADLRPEVPVTFAHNTKPVRDWLTAIEANPDEAACVGRVYADGSWAEAEA